MFITRCRGDGTPSDARRLLDILLMFLLIPLTSAVTVHEYGHLTMMRVLGLQGYIRSDFLTRTEYISSGGTLWQMTAVSTAGGLSAFVVFALMWIMTSDVELRLALSYTWIQNLLYGLSEGTVRYVGLDFNCLFNLSIISSVVAAVVAVYLFRVEHACNHGREILNAQGS